jgi:large subunit ribosomal protein L5
MEKTNPMREIMLDKVTLNMCIGNFPEEIEKGKKILESITGRKALITKAKIRQPKWNIRPGVPIGVKVTLRGKKAEEILADALLVKGKELKKRNFDNQGNFGFGIHEHIELPKVKYDPKLGIKGLDIIVTLKRRGYRIKNKKIKRTKIGRNHIIKKEEGINFIKEKFGVKIIE